MNTVKYNLPSHWLTYLFYNDASGLADEEVEEIDGWLECQLEDTELFVAVGSEHYGFGVPTIGGLPSELHTVAFQTEV